MIPTIKKYTAVVGSFITLSNYYAFPTHQVTVRGQQFTPHETISVSVGAESKNVTADRRGNFASSFTIPWEAIGATLIVAAEGSKTDGLAEAQVEVGNYYPNIEPNRYYIPTKGMVRFTGRNFAPNEMVRIEQGENSLGTVRADRTGRIRTRAIAVPEQAGRYLYTLTGVSSGAADSKIIIIYGNRKLTPPRV